MPKKNLYKNSEIKDNNIVIDTSEWEAQNKIDYVKMFTTKRDNVEFMFTYYELDGRERKEYEVDYYLVNNKNYMGYVPTIKKYVVREDGKIETKHVQVGGLISALELDQYLLKKYEKKLLAEKDKNNTSSNSQTPSSSNQNEMTENKMIKPNSPKSEKYRPVRIGDDMPDFLL